MPFPRKEAVVACLKRLLSDIGQYVLFIELGRIFTCRFLSLKTGARACKYASGVDGLPPIQMNYGDQRSSILP